MRSAPASRPRSRPRSTRRPSTRRMPRTPIRRRRCSGSSRRIGRPRRRRRGASATAMTPRRTPTRTPRPPPRTRSTDGDQDVHRGDPRHARRGDAARRVRHRPRRGCRQEWRGLKVVSPSTPYDAKGLLRSSIRDEDPVLFFEHKKMYRSVRGDVPETDYVVPLGKAAITHPGTQITVIAYGLMAHYALEAADIVADEGIRVEVVDLRTLRPLDKETVLGSVKKTGKCLIVYEDNRFLGYGAEIAAIVAEEAFDFLDGPVTRIAGPDVPGVPYNHVLEDWFMVNPEKIAAGIRKLAAY